MNKRGRGQRLATAVGRVPPCLAAEFDARLIEISLHRADVQRGNCGYTPRVVVVGPPTCRHCISARPQSLHRRESWLLLPLFRGNFVAKFKFIGRSCVCRRVPSPKDFVSTEIVPGAPQHSPMRAYGSFWDRTTPGKAQYHGGLDAQPWAAFR